MMNDMVDMIGKYGILVIALLSHLCLAQATDVHSPLDTLQIAKAHYASGAYSRSVTMLETALPYLSGNQLIEAHVFLAFDYVAIGDDASAIEHFKNALTKDPNLQLDGYAPTPDILTVFEDARKEKAYESAGCSCFIPGIGQIFKGDKSKGRVIIAASVLTLAGTLVSWSIADSKHTAYLSLGPDNLDQMDDVYNDYNRWRKITILSGAAFVGIYVYSIFDAMLSLKKTKTKTSNLQTGFHFKCDGNHTQIGYAIGI
ncbi:MAG: hypothetical protein JSW49_02055 [candidate division WOR-3 bacterium]|nr:MAG: hypothetical protein JSW49_02055 [candidate division WOR-3 bacterium]